MAERDQKVSEATMSRVGLYILLVTFAALFIGTTVYLYQKSVEKPVIFETAKPFTTDIVRKTVAIGKIVPRKEVDIKSQVSGVVEKFYVAAGQAVEEDELIAKIRIIPNMEHLNLAESQLQTARINLQNAEREHRRQEKLFHDRLISESEFNKSLLNLELQREAVSSSESNLSIIREGASAKAGKVSNLVRATFAGMVLDLPVEEGTFVIETNTFNEGTTIANIANMQDLIFEGTVDESEVGKLREGMKLTLNIGALEAESFDAVLEYIAPKGIDESGTIKFEIRAAVDLPEGKFLRAGYSANADIVLDRRDEVLAINEGLLQFEGSDTYVEVETEPQVFERRKVETGLSDGINIEILSGIDVNAVLKKS